MMITLFMQALHGDHQQFFIVKECEIMQHTYNPEMHSTDELCYFYLELGCIVWVSARKKYKP